jgi:hypothetical protein
VGVVEGTWLGLRVRTCQPGRCIGATENGMSTVEYSNVVNYTNREVVRTGFSRFRVRYQLILNSRLFVRLVFLAR